MLLLVSLQAFVRWEAKKIQIMCSQVQRKDIYFPYNLQVCASDLFFQTICPKSAQLFTKEKTTCKQVFLIRSVNNIDLCMLTIVTEKSEKLFIIK